MKENEIGEACSTYGRKNLKERDSLEDISVNGRIMLEWILQ
jgi:hypothetical protein